jgi:hypothetical protein
MKVTVDTRHDSLEEALATVRAAFGTSGDSRPVAGPRETPRKVARSTADTANQARSGSRRSVTRPAARRSAAKKTAAPRASQRNGRKATSPLPSTSNIAPPGQADAIRAWARAHGMEVKRAGRLPAAVIRAYQESPPG